MYGRSLEEEYAVSPTSGNFFEERNVTFCKYIAQFIFNRENSQGAPLMSYLSSKDPIPMSPLNVSTKSDGSMMSFDNKVDNSSDVPTMDG